MTAYVSLVGFSRALRAEGVSSSTAAVIDFCRACSLLEATELYWSGRVTLVAKREDVPVYDRVFAEYFGVNAGDQESWAASRSVERRAMDDGRDPCGDSSDDQEVLASRVEVLRQKDFATMTDGELAEVIEMMRGLRLMPPLRASRRRRSARRGEVDLRRTVRQALRSNGDRLDLRHRRRRRRPRRLILILDVSRSMADYSRALMMFAHVGVRSEAHVEVFCFGTRLTRLTPWMSRAGVEDPLPPMSELVPDWDGGTRIGESLKAFLDGYGHAGLARGAVAIVCSDGLEEGGPEVLHEQMARLGRLCHRVIWANPLKGTDGYQPTARGMKAALPYIDDFASCRNLADLKAVGGLVSRALADAVGPVQAERRHPIHRV